MNLQMYKFEQTTTQKRVVLFAAEKYVFKSPLEMDQSISESHIEKQKIALRWTLMNK